MRSSVDTACSGSSEEIKIGAGVLDYISELGNIQAKILEAYTYSEQCVQNIESDAIPLKAEKNIRRITMYSTTVG